MINFTLIIESLPTLLNGALLSLFIGMILGILLGFMHHSNIKWLKTVVTIYVEVIRGTPMLLQILVVFYVLPQFGINIPGVLSAIIAIGINSSAYISQIVRGGLQTIPIGQIEAANILGFSKLQTYYLIILPQLFKIILPSIGNEIITLIKDSSLASIIGVMEITKCGSIIRSRTYDPISILLAVAAFYLITTFTISYILKNLEKKI